jgi:hypothetical protein
VLAAPARDATSPSATSIARALVIVGLLTSKRTASSLSEGRTSPGANSPDSICSRSSLAICSEALALWTGMGLWCVPGYLAIRDILDEPAKALRRCSRIMQEMVVGGPSCEAVVRWDVATATPRRACP